MRIQTRLSPARFVPGICCVHARPFHRSGITIDGSEGRHLNTGDLSDPFGTLYVEQTRIWSDRLARATRVLFVSVLPASLIRGRTHAVIAASGCGLA